MEKKPLARITTKSAIALIVFFIYSNFSSSGAATSTNPDASPDNRGDHCGFPAIFNFGDSNSDTGGLSASGFSELRPPYGSTYFHEPAGRSSDGRLILDFMAEALSLPFIDAYLDSLGTNFRHGANFATSQSTLGLPTLPVRPLGLVSPFDLDVQCLQFKIFKSKALSLNKLGGLVDNMMPTEDDFSKALYTFDIGQVDISIMLLKNTSSEKIHPTIDNLITNLTRNVVSIYKLGARNFLIFNTAPIGCMTYILVRVPPPVGSPVDRAGCVTSYNKVSQYFNQKLKEAVVQLGKDYPSAAFTYVDIYSIKYNLFNDPRKYGFKHTMLVCCGYGGKYNYGVANCGENVTINGHPTVVSSCSQPRHYVNWDGSHLTEAANGYIFNQILMGAYSDPPVPLKKACVTP